MMTSRAPILRGRGWAETVLVACVAAGLATALLSDPYLGTVVVVVALVLIVFAVLPLSWGVPVLLVLTPLRLYVSPPGTGLDVPVMTFVVVGAAILSLASALRVQRPRLRRPELIAIAWLLWTTLSIAWSTDRPAAFRGLLQWLMVFGGVLLGALCVGGSTDPVLAARRVFTAVVGLVGFWSLVGFVQVALGLDRIKTFLQAPAAALFFAPGLTRYRVAAAGFNWTDGKDVQPFGPFINAIGFGILTAVGLGMAAALAVRRSTLAPRRLVLGALPLAAAANIACLKATGWMSSGVAIAIALVSLGRSIRRVLAVSLALVGVLCLVVFAYREEITERLVVLAVREGARGATTEALSRPAIWLAYLGAARQHPIWGLGLATARRYGPIHWSYFEGADGARFADRLPTENSYLTTFIETGAVGLVLLLATLGGAMIRGLKLSRRYPNDRLAEAAGLAAIGIAALLIGNFTTDGFTDDVLGVLLGVLVGVVLAAGRLVPQPTGAA